MWAIIAKEWGDPSVLTYIEKPTPELKPEELLIKVEAASLNRADLLQRRGKYPPPPGESEILGLEIAGEVVEMGHNVRDFKKGARVFGLVGSGGYAEYCPIHQGCAMPIPETLSFTEAAAIPEAFLTSQEALFTLGEIKKNDCVLIHAGGSGVGSAAIQLAKLKEATVITTVSAPAKIVKVKALGADEVINYKEIDFARVAPPVDVIIDFIGADYLARHIKLLKNQGRLICVGLMGGTSAPLALDQVLSKRLQIKGLMMRTRSAQEKRIMTAYFKENFLPFFTQQRLHPVIDTLFSFEEVAAAHQYMENNTHVGKIVLTTHKD